MTSSPEKKPLPTGVKSHVDMIIDISSSAAKTIMYPDAKLKAIFYLVLVTVLSAFSAYTPLKADYYLATKTNFINVFVVKLGWLWTSSILGPFIFIVSYGSVGSNAGKTIKDMSRLLIATAVWFITTTIFETIEQNTGICTGAVGSHKKVCYNKGGTWITGVDISGHCFLIIYSSLIMTEEVTAIKNWYSKDNRHLKNVANTLLTLIGVLDIIWIIQLVITSLHYHTIVHKIIGAGIAVAVWFFTYRGAMSLVLPVSSSPKNKSKMVHRKKRS
uniref:FIT family protein n=1 Tax=Rhabditophanes sp. KR3021 TaxID=114890 RepID=A0AC35UB14_9BILA